VLLMIAGACYLVHNLPTLLEPAVAVSLAPAIYVPMFIAEFALAAWLLIRGVHSARWKETQELASGARWRSVLAATGYE
jgi:uncharacterized membrane protein